MFVQPWHLDSYPFVAEAVYIQRSGHIAELTHYLSESPILGLTWGPFLSVTGLDPLVLLKLYPGFIVAISSVLVYMIASKSKLGTRASIVASLLFLSILWPFVFHFSRWSCSIVLYFFSLFPLVYLVFQRFDRRIFVLLIFLIVVLAISHPATPLYLILNLAGMITLAVVFRGIRSKERGLLFFALTVSAVVWLLWNMIGTSPGIILDLKGIGETIVASLVESPSEVSGAAKIVGSHTEIYNTVQWARLLITLVAYLTSFLIPIVMYRYFKEKKQLLILTGWAWSNMLTTVPLLYAGLPYFQKPALFTIASCGPITAIIFEKTSVSKIKSMMRIFLVIFIVMSSMLIPLTKYAPLPMEYPTSRELAGKTFLDLYVGRGIPFIYFETPAWGYSYVLLGYEPTSWVGAIALYKPLRAWDVYIPGEGLNSSVLEGASLWVTYRLSVRDAFILNTPSWEYVTENVTLTLPASTHNKVYDSGWPECILIPLPKKQNF